MTYLWEDDEGNVWESPISDDLKRGRCTGIPECCITFFLFTGVRAPYATAADWGYIACPKCVDAGNRIEPKHCSDLKEACTCGAWVDRIAVKLDDKEVTEEDIAAYEKEQENDNSSQGNC